MLSIQHRLIGVIYLFYANFKKRTHASIATIAATAATAAADDDFNVLSILLFNTAMNKPNFSVHCTVHWTKWSAVAAVA